MLSEVEVVVDGLHFPECLRWYEGRLYFSDMYGDQVHAYDPVTGTLDTVAELFHPAGIGWLPDGRMLVAAAEDHLIVDVTNNCTYADLSDWAPGWLNDMFVDDAGWIYLGNFGFDQFSEEPRSTQLVTISPDGNRHVQLDDVIFPNGTVKRSDGKIVVAESFAKQLTTFSNDGSGTLTRESSLSLGEFIPDGTCIDVEDHIWASAPEGTEVARIAPDGNMGYRAVGERSFACMLGGDDRRTLYVATSPGFIPDERRGKTDAQIRAVRVDVPGAGLQGLGG